ncbi:hypothetical protein AX17_002734 [Amanita inopinata Kibby_2008]|nr:hypothetical protein AX17_002734 [Amanita inopinata Kibby_2008]
MLVNAVAENVLGTIGTICWTAQLVPQIWKSWREGSTKGLSHWLVLIWGITGAFLGTYAIVQNLNIPLILQPQLFALLSLISWGQCQYYEKGRSKLTASLLALAVMVLTGAFEVAMVFAVRPSYKQGNNRGVMFFGILTSVLIALALLPQYWEIYRHREVIGISLTFMLVDLIGGVFSDLSLAFKEKFDVVAGVAYTLVIVMDGIVLLAALILNPRAARRRKEEAAASVESQGESDNACESTAVRISSPSVTAVGHGTQEDKEDKERNSVHSDKMSTKQADTDSAAWVVDIESGVGIAQAK